ncbi:class F sortase [Serinicoccus profundi]|uniref:class F sortase n=1 Tax=Serinicoccus profundi TaxID=1078471 RepID=UPI000255E223|nr:class F sortase [Serinicoccus profundi]
MPRTQPRRGRFSPAAAAVLLSSLVVVALALWGLQRGPLPAAADFGSSAPATPSTEGGSAVPGAAVGPVTTAAPLGGVVTRADPDREAADREGADREETDRAADRTRVRVETPGVRDASVAAVAPDPGGVPVRLLAPTLGLDVPLDAVGVTGDGLMEIPEDADRAGWYRFGPQPGEDGSAVIAGHVDDREGPGAFLALDGAREGTPITVVRADGTELDYTVTARRTTEKKELPVDDVFDRDGPARLQLITCTGEWSERAGSYSDNLVITATPAR